MAADTGETPAGGFGRVSRTKDIAFRLLALAATLVGIVSLAALLLNVAVDAVGWLDWQFLTNPPHPNPYEAGFLPALVGSIAIMLMIALVTFPLGVGAAVYLEEYADDGYLTRFIQLNIANLAGVPSVVYGLLGLGLFVGLFNIGYGTVLAAAFTIALLILPIVIISAQEAIRAVPDSQRQASYGMGATKWQTIRNVVLPRAMPGIMTGTILALGRAIGETAPLIMIAAPTTVFGLPNSFFSKVSAMPLQIYNWASYPQTEFQYGVVAAGVVTLLVVLLTINSIAIIIRNRYQQRT
ncbi:phosphate ABC transporter, inner membrane subunit PstA [Natrinema pellirubrum DSM 15624]|uniref:Phosphate transport system permease protein PstA n=1 Tax=Natrinema pellirubrum (strain DSM 15624 / CIP 106293 / JCM 10476 / NCIMB 786 / 157) TaxID=797303 RepID=L0JKD0_NATP1|nr:phosphate ABC transporter permease PstA [Natrinema pellirubrum]AGB31042.1 phosphate ABC transporter, permease protein PstA [Natrinema pellirubrum DSM 15624]ELY81115.1 phosphate ABC transporter, inner membrane subunit PstA [Natrinema pellirubrum DSM 15624]